MKYAIIVLMLVLVGCTSTVSRTVENSLSYKNPEGVDLDVVGHKDTIIEGLEIKKPDGTVIKMAKYVSAANAGAVEESGSSERNMQNVLKTMVEIIDRRLSPVGVVAP